MQSEIDRQREREQDKNRKTGTATETERIKGVGLSRGVDTDVFGVQKCKSLIPDSSRPSTKVIH